jgi:NADPH2:quinone reductase
MKAILCTRFGGPDDLEFKEIPDPTPGPGDVVVAVKAAALNFFDTLIIAGKYQYKPPFPFSPAAEFSGVVESVGPQVTALRPGDRVLGHIGAGAARQKVVAKPERLIKLPDGLEFERAAGLTVTYGTTLHALKDRAELKSGETLAVLGAAGGTGLATIELGKIMGARVIACASSAEKLAFARQHGADEAINYSAEDLKDALRRVTDGKGADVIYDPVGGRYAEPAVRALAWGGRYLVIGFAAGEIPKIALNLVLLRSSALVGVFWGAWAERNPQAHRANMGEIARWCADGKLSAHVHAAYPLEKTADAIKALSNREVMGKLVLRP